jgi:hypothetical protein
MRLQVFLTLINKIKMYETTYEMKNDRWYLDNEEVF